MRLTLLIALKQKEWFNQNSVHRKIEKAYRIVARPLPAFSKNINTAVRPYFQSIIPEYGTGARTWDAEFIEIWFDKTIPYGKEKMLRSIYQTVFHEANYAARWNGIPEDYRLIESAIFEGLATVFKRESTHYAPLYGNYEDDDTMRAWFDEIKQAGTDWGGRDELFFNNKDGRCWIGYKTSTWIVDSAIKRSSKSVIKLTSLPADEIIQLADL